jgi:hypothetical protein
LGWTSVEAAELSGVPKRTVQEWRKTGFFVPALPAVATGHAADELYALADVVTLRLMRFLLSVGAEREVVARFGEVFLVDSESGSPYFARDWVRADTELWCLVPATLELWDLEPPDGSDRKDGEGCRLRFFTTEMLEQSLEEDSEGISRDDDGVYWRDEDGSLLMVWLPMTRQVTGLASKADHWRRQRRIPMHRWPAWM